MRECEAGLAKKCFLYFYLPKLREAGKAEHPPMSWVNFLEAKLRDRRRRRLYTTSFSPRPSHKQVCSPFHFFFRGVIKTGRDKFRRQDCVASISVTLAGEAPCSAYYERRNRSCGVSSLFRAAFPLGRRNKQKILPVGLCEEASRLRSV